MFNNVASRGKNSHPTKEFKLSLETQGIRKGQHVTVVWHLMGRVRADLCEAKTSLVYISQPRAKYRRILFQKQQVWGQ